jgi:hypothetical protein
MGENNWGEIDGYIFMFRPSSTNNIAYYYTNGTSKVEEHFTNFFQNLDDQ